MEIKNSKKWASSSGKGYLYAVLGVFISFCIRYSLQDFLQDGMPLTFFIVNTILISLFYGMWPGLLSVILAAPIAFFFFVPPFNSYELPTLHDAFVYVSYIFIDLTAIAVIEWLQRERYRAVLLAKVSESRYQLLSQLSNVVKNSSKDKSY